jgi:hypothetical protein
MPKKRALSSDDEEVGGLAPPHKKGNSSTLSLGLALPPKKGSSSTPAPGPGSRDMFASSTSGSSAHHKENLEEMNSPKRITESPVRAGAKQPRSQELVQPVPSSSRMIAGGRKRHAETKSNEDDFFGFGGQEKIKATGTQGKSRIPVNVEEEDIFGFGPAEERVSKQLSIARPGPQVMIFDDEDVPAASRPQQEIKTGGVELIQKARKETPLVPAFQLTKKTNMADSSLVNSTRSDGHLDSTGFIGKVCIAFIMFIQILGHKIRVK